MIQLLLPRAATLLAMTLRYEWSGQPLPERAVIVFWHGDMFAGWWSVRKLRPVALVSKSRDGGLLAAVLQGWRYRLVRGSSKKNGMEALMEACAFIRRGEARTLVITPDGPKGPYEELKRGAFIAADELTLPVFFLRISYSRAKIFRRSWDNFRLPLPFSSVRVRTERIDSAGWPQSKDEQLAWLQTQSLALKSGF